MNNLGGEPAGGGLERAARLVLDSQYVVALVGAGLSVESGIPPFRGPGGLWTRYGQPSMLSYQEFARDPRLWWEMRLRDEVELGNPVYELKLAVDQATPNAGHYALVELERSGVLKYSITQNVDDLQRRAGSIALVEVHGNRARLRCIRCGSRRPREGFPMVELPPQCPECGGILKLDTVMFGEAIPPPALQACREQVQRCDCMLLIGTSGSVNPAAQLPLLARQGGARLIEVNPHETSLTPLCDLTLSGRSEELLPLLVDRVRSGRAARGL
jgi:NAD-dependent deacetylase